MGFLQPGELYPIDFSRGKLICKVLSFKQQREVVKLIKALQNNSDPEEAMNLVEQIIAKAATSWSLEETFSVDGLLEKIGFLEAMDIGKKITEGGNLSETERKK